MSLIQYLGAALLFVLAGCQGMPTVTRSGDVKDVIIGDNLSLAEVSVSPGDEVRWVNKRTAPVRVVFLDPVSDGKLSCRNNFGGLMARSDTAKLDMNETASACFRDPGYFRYTVRMEKAGMTGERNVSGVVKVGGMAHGAGVTSEQESTRASDNTGSSTSDKTGSMANPKSTTTTTTTTTVLPPQ